jgi:hypothetical protein
VFYHEDDLDQVQSEAVKRELATKETCRLEAGRRKKDHPIWQALFFRQPARQTGPGHWRSVLDSLTLYLGAWLPFPFQLPTRQAILEAIMEVE